MTNKITIDLPDDLLRFIEDGRGTLSIEDWVRDACEVQLRLDLCGLALKKPLDEQDLAHAVLELKCLHCGEI